MKCSKCRVLVDDSLNFCPLCKTKLKNNNSNNNFYPCYQKINILSLRYNLFSYSAIFICALSLVLNLFFYNKIFWSAIVIGISFYIWFFINHTIASKSSFGEKIFYNFLVASTLLFLFDKIVGNGSLSFDYTIPILVIGIVFSINMIVFIYKFKWKDYFVYHIIFSLICISSFIYYLFSETNITWPWVIAIYFSTISVLFIFFKFFRKLKLEIIKRFHI